MEKNEREWLLREKYDGRECPEFFADLARLEAGEPLAYVIGFVNFLGAKIGLTSRPLIPRTETEYWVEKVLKEISENSPKILDIFSGSGCVGIAASKNVPGATVDFAEKDEAHAEQIKKNLKQNGLRGSVFVSDVFDGIPAKKYDLILANPPYIGRGDETRVQESVLAHEPHAALFADDNGLFFIKKLVKEGPAFLKPGGKMYIEFGEGQKEELERLAPGAEFWKDQYGKWRVMVIRI